MPYINSIVIGFVFLLFWLSYKLKSDRHRLAELWTPFRVHSFACRFLFTERLVFFYFMVTNFFENLLIPPYGVFIAPLLVSLFECFKLYFYWEKLSATKNIRPWIYYFFFLYLRYLFIWKYWSLYNLFKFNVTSI